MLHSRLRRPGVALGGMVLAVAFLLWTQAMRVEVWSPDEEYFVQLSRVLAENLPRALWDLPVNAFDDRGLQRLHILVLAWPLSVVTGELGWAIARAAMCLAFASAAIPAYLIARGVRLTAGWALAAALLTVMVPWAVLATTVLSENVAYAAALWAVYGAWRACIVAGWRADVVALGLAFLAAFSRTNLIVLAGVAPVAVAVTALLAARAESRRRWVRRAAAETVREHPILALVLVGGGTLFVLSSAGVGLGPFAALTGGYVTSLHIVWDVFLAKVGSQLSAIVLGVGFVPAVLAVPWVLRGAVRWTSRAEAGLAVSALAGVVLVLLSTLYAADEERYIVYVAPLFVIPGVVALARRDLPAWSVALSGLLLAALVARQTWDDILDPARVLLFAEETFVGRVVFNRIDLAVGGDPLTVLVIVLAVVVAALTAVFARRVSARAPIAMLAVLLLVQLGQSQWTVREYARLTKGAGPHDARMWIDERVPGRQTAGMLAWGAGNSGLYTPFWREVVFWNRQADRIFTAGGLAGPHIPRYGGHSTLKVDPRTGEVSRDDREAMPRWLLVPTQFASVGVAGESIARSEYLPLALVRTRGRTRFTYVWEGPEPDGWLTAEQPTAEATIFPAAWGAAGRSCVKVTLVAPAEGFDGAHRYDITAGDLRLDGALRAGQLRRVKIPARAGLRRISIRTRGSSKDPSGRRVTLQLADAAVGPCDRP